MKRYVKAAACPLCVPPPVPVPGEKGDLEQLLAQNLRGFLLQP